MQPRSQGLRGETVTKTLVKFVLSFQNFGKKIACAVRHNRIAIHLNTVVSHCACDFFPKFWNDKMNFTRVFVTVSPRRPWDRGWFSCGRRNRVNTNTVTSNYEPGHHSGQVAHVTCTEYNAPTSRYYNRKI